jgi:hypothetical protein
MYVVSIYMLHRKAHALSSLDVTMINRLTISLRGAPERGVTGRPDHPDDRPAGRSRFLPWGQPPKKVSFGSVVEERSSNSGGGTFELAPMRPYV